MKCLLTVLLIIGLPCSTGLCAEAIVQSKVEAVDLHLDSAEVTRLAHYSLPRGETSIVLRGLSPHLLEQSLRISGLEADGVSIRSVSTHRENAASASAIAPERQALLDEQEDLRGRLNALRTKEGMIRNVASVQPSLLIGAAGSAITPDFWPSIWTKVADGLEDTDHRIRDAQKRLDFVTATLAQTSNQGSALSAQTFEVVLEVSADRAVEADLKLVYEVGGASWQPLYDARLRTDRQPAQVELTRRAKVLQSTGEDWTDIPLTLSTSRLSAATSAPTLNETSDVTGNSGDIAARMATLPRAMTSKTGTPEETFSNATSYDASLKVPGRVSLASGAKSRLYSIASRNTDVDMIVKSVPLADSHAYLQAKFENTDRLSLIPGETELYRDGTFIGRSILPGAGPGDQVMIGFGVDDLVSIERQDLKRKERNTTIQAGTASVQRAFKTVVTNRHRFPVRIEIEDREPAFNNVAIELKELPVMTPPTERQVEGHRGVLGWTYDYAPGQARAMTLAWTVRWPAKLGPIHASEQTQYFRFSGGATF